MGSEFHINEYSDDLSQPSLATFEDGAFVVVYSADKSDTDRKKYFIVGKIYDKAGEVLVNEFKVTKKLDN